MKFLILSIGVIFTFLCIWHEMVSYEVSRDGYYQGKVIDKIEGNGRWRSSKMLIVDFDCCGEDVILVSELTYWGAKVGDILYTEWDYIPFFGVSGFAYVPPLYDHSSFLYFSISMLKIMIFFSLLFGVFFICTQTLARSPYDEMRLTQNSAREALNSNISKALKISEERRNDAENSLRETNRKRV